MHLALDVFNITVPVLLCILAGAVWTRLRMPFDNAMVTPLLMYLAVPCLLLSSFSGMQLPAGVLLRLLVAAVLAHVSFALLGWLVLRVLGLEVRSYLSSMLFGNTGNLGLPLCMLAYGTQGLSLGLVFMIVNTVGLFTVGVWINSGSLTPTHLFKTPTLYAAGAALALGLSGVQLPEVIFETFDILGQMAIPLMLLALGAALTTLTVGNLRESVLLSLLKLGVNLVTGVLVAWLLGLEGVARDVFLLQCLMPVAVFNYLLAEHYGRESGEIAGFILVSSLLALPVLPLALAMLL